MYAGFEPQNTRRFTDDVYDCLQHTHSANLRRVRNTIQIKDAGISAH